MAGWHALSGHFSFQERFFALKLRPYGQVAENATMSASVALKGVVTKMV